MNSSVYFRMLLRAFVKIISAYFLGAGCVFIISLFLPFLFSSYGFYGFLLSSFLSAVTLMLAESRYFFVRTQKKWSQSKIIAIFFMVSFMSAVIFQLWLEYELSGSSMSSWLNGEQMRIEGKPTTFSWLLGIKFCFLTGIVSAIIGYFYCWLDQLMSKKIKHE